MRYPAREQAPEIFANAVKIRIWSEQTNKDYINIYIQDNGIGIAEDKVTDIFLPFQRLNEAQSFEGFGLGLALCQMVIDQHMANISVKSKVNQGSVFLYGISDKPLSAQSTL